MLWEGLCRHLLPHLKPLFPKLVLHVDSELRSASEPLFLLFLPPDSPVPSPPNCQLQNRRDRKSLLQVCRSAPALIPAV